jgi:ABC-2 type transport system ATP-binding protein
MLVCDNIVKTYGAFRAVDGVNLSLVPGKVIALLGPNGSGKSTLMKMIVGLIQPTSGNIYLNDEPLSDESRNYITYMPTENYFYNYMSIKDVVTFYKDFYADFKEDVFYSILQKMQLSHEGKIRNMSTGMLAKFKVAVAMARDSKVIMLDEPLNGIDLIARENVIGAIKEYMTPDKILLVSSHIVDELETISDGVIYMRNGVVVESGDIESVKAQNDGMSLVDIYKKIYGGGYYNA